LLQGVIADAKRQEAAVIDFFCPSGRLRAALKRSGFFTRDEAPTEEIPILFQPICRRRTGIPLMVYPGERLGQFPLDRWYVTKGDGDQDRPN
jgi:hypothetical protein